MSFLRYSVDIYPERVYKHRYTILVVSLIMNKDPSMKLRYVYKKKRNFTVGYYNNNKSPRTDVFYNGTKRLPLKHKGSEDVNNKP